VNYWSIRPDSVSVTTECGDIAGLLDVSGPELGTGIQLDTEWSHTINERIRAETEIALGIRESGRVVILRAALENPTGKWNCRGEFRDI